MKLSVWHEINRSKHRRGGRIYASVRYIDPATGDKKRVKTYSKEEMLATESRLQSMLLNHQTGHGNPGAIPLVVMESYLLDLTTPGKVEKIRRASTINMKRQNLTPYLESVFKLSDITDDSIKSYIQLMQKKYKIDTIAIRLRDLRAFLNWCVKEKMLKESPFKGFSIPTSEFVGRRLTQEEIQAIKAVVENPLVTPLLFQTFFLLAFDTGARHGELLAVEWHELDLNEGYWHIPAHKCKTRINRTLPLSEHVIAAFKSLPRASNRVFEGLNRWKVQRMWKAVLKRAGVTGRVRIHDIRHTYASNWQGRGAGLKVMEGWSTDAMMSKYTHTELSFLKEEARRTAQTLWSTNDKKSETK